MSERGWVGLVWENSKLNLRPVRLQTETHEDRHIRTLKRVVCGETLRTFLKPVLLKPQRVSAGI